MKYLLFSYVLVIALVLTTFSTFAQQPVAVTQTELENVTDTLSKKIRDWYVYPEVAARLATSLKADQRGGRYAAVKDPYDLAARLTQDLVLASKDKHFNVAFDPGWVSNSRRAMTKKDSLELAKRDFPNERRENYGFREVRILEGNIGYMNLTTFWDPLYGGEAAVHAMGFLSNADAIIIDLRSNGGGYGTMVQLLSSYFFEGEPVHLVDLYNRQDGKTTQDYTLPFVPGKRLPEIPLFLLTGKQTFSGAESFAYLMKNRKRAVLVGAVTGGGAHPTMQIAIGDRFVLSVPFARPIDPITKTDWEGTGVRPDVAVPEQDALASAQVLALEKLAAGDSSSRYRWPLTELKARLHPVSVAQATLRSYAGTYGERKLVFENGRLYYSRNGLKYELIPLDQFSFLVSDVPSLRLRLVIRDGRAIMLERTYDDGTAAQDMRR